MLDKPWSWRPVVVGEFEARCCVMEKKHVSIANVLKRHDHVLTKFDSVFEYPLQGFAITDESTHKIMTFFCD